MVKHITFCKINIKQNDYHIYILKVLQRIANVTMYMGKTWYFFVHAITVILVFCGNLWLSWSNGVCPKLTETLQYHGIECTHY